MADGSVFHLSDTLVYKNRISGRCITSLLLATKNSTQFPEFKSTLQNPVISSITNGSSSFLCGIAEGSLCSQGWSQFHKNYSVHKFPFFSYARKGKLLHQKTQNSFFHFCSRHKNWCLLVHVFSLAGSVLFIPATWPKWSPRSQTHNSISLNFPEFILFQLTHQQFDQMKDFVWRIPTFP